ncbi:TadE-like protein [Pseudovibrio axinellae]|uniref:TadE-like protein n=1 Tax=Pseudovibrio axinellae TaxID=989403 RepID=A0A166B7D7_9HYPH|nr:TadE/TadG family type IV pilus assembly protein [Pseudovibrio axinellae]KZL21982.1 TadE-like protein [Pseudovibrio axinellae]SEQ59855.1 Flp pilus assembly protein TadG [Pseudovibrio axinellae]
MYRLKAADKPSKPKRSWRCLTNARRLSKDARGVTAIEFAFIAPVLFLVVFAILELGLSFLVEVILDNAVSEAARKIRTGQVFNAEAAGEYDQSDFRADVLDLGGGLLKSVEDGVYISVTSVPDFGRIPDPEPLIEDGEVIMDEPWSPGVRNEVVMVRVIVEWPLITSKMVEVFGQTSNGSRILVATEIFRNEPF